MQSSSKALAMAAFGARGTGKTAWVVQELRRGKPRRLLVWDYKHDPSLREVGMPVSTLAEMIRAMTAKTFALRFMVDHSRDVHAQFELFCKAAYLAGNLTMFVDELPEVTKANKAPPAWRRCVNVGRDYVVSGDRKSLTIIGAGQRPAECDKTFIANCDVLHVGRLGDMGDAKRIASSWGVNPAELATLPDLHYLEKRADQPDLVRGVLRFGRKTTIETKKPAPEPDPARFPKGATLGRGAV